MSTTTTAEHQEEGEYPDLYSIFKFAMNSSVTGDRYTKPYIENSRFNFF
jgi:hypothetical protein